MTENKQQLSVVANDIAPVELVDSLKNSSTTMYCSIVNSGDRKSQIKIYNAINSAEEQLADHIGEVLEVVDVVAHPVELVDEETGEVFQALRTVLITKDGKGYSATSQGITSALSKIFSIVGMPDGGAWHAEPVKMKIKQVKTRNGNNKVNTIELV